jgi:hypothetical protein
LILNMAQISNEQFMLTTSEIEANGCLNRRPTPADTREKGKFCAAASLDALPVLNVRLIQLDRIDYIFQDV